MLISGATKHGARNDSDHDICNIATTARWEVAHVDTLRRQIRLREDIPQDSCLRAAENPYALKLRFSRRRREDDDAWPWPGGNGMG